MSFFGKNIRKIRGFKGLSQAAFAEIFDVNRSNIGAYEEGRAEPKIDLIIEIAKYFSISLEDMVGKELTINDISSFKLFDEGPTIKKEQESPKILQPILVRAVDQNYYINHHRDKPALDQMKISNDFGILTCDRIFELTSPLDGLGLSAGDYVLCDSELGSEGFGIGIYKEEIKAFRIEDILNEDFSESWRINGYIKKNLTHTSLEARMNHVEKSLIELKARLKID
ncbi:MAG: helix-turn-helix domain-containing protein [Flavobacteriales bacterium]|nr:helix-turn-helix domain-containing protein [Flavobacteriales bacterium]